MCEIYDDGNGADVYRCKERRANRPHRCQSCGTPILPGERYVYGSGVHEGSGFSEKGCLGCQKIRKAFGDAHHYYPAFPDLAQALADCISEGDPESLSWSHALHVIRARRHESDVCRAATKAIVLLLEASTAHA